VLDLLVYHQSPDDKENGKAKLKGHQYFSRRAGLLTGMYFSFENFGWLEC
jgi:hypothetical protein